MASAYYPEGYFTTTLSSDINASTTTIPLSVVPSRVTSGYMVIEPTHATKREVIHFTSVGVSSVTSADDTTDASDASGRGCLGSITQGANTTHLQGVTVLIAATEKYWKRLYDKLNGDADGIVIPEINDSNGNEVAKFASTASAVNETTTTNAATGAGPTISATGGDTNIDLNLQPKGTGAVVIKGTADSAAEIRLSEDTDNGTNYVGLKAPASTANLTLTLPSADGTSGQVLSTNGSGTLSFSSTSANTLNMFNNAIINGAFDIWQRGATFTTPNDDTYGPDRWNFLVDGNGAWTFIRDTDVPSGGLFKYSLKATNVTLNKQCAIVYFLENQDAIKFDDRAVSLSFYAKTSGTEIGNLRATVLSWDSTADTVTSDVVGTWAGAGTDPTWATNWTAEAAGSNKALTSSWQRFTVENISVDTASMANLAVVIWVDDTTIAANDDFWVTGVQLNDGASAISFMPKHVAVEQRDCDRYFQLYNADETNSRIGFGSAASTTVAHIVINLREKMRIVPALTATATDWRVSDFGAGTDLTAIALTASSQTTSSVLIQCTVAAGLTANRPYTLEADGNANRQLLLSSEL